jgi:uncharacterized protein
MNPFKFGQVVEGTSFCHRDDLQKTLKSYIVSAQNTVLQGDRRMGKTSLVFETVRSLRKYRLLSIDLMGIKSADDLCKRIARALISLEQQSGMLEKALSAFARLRPKITFDPVSGQPGVSFDSAVKLTPDSIKGLFDLIKQAAARKPTVVFMDEFQDILNLADSEETLALLRAEIQHHQDIPYIFAGSMRNQMMEIFTLPDSPFFKSALPLEIGPIHPQEFIPFLIEKFATGERVLSPDLCGQLLILADHTSGDTQQLCSALWETTHHGATLGEEHLHPALLRIFAQETKGYEAMLIQITAQQQNCLRALAALGGKNPYSETFLRETGIQHASSVKKAITRLCQLQIIYPREKDFRFINPFFKHWLTWKNL